MFRDRMLGSMSDSSASGVFRIRPANTAQSCHSEVTGSGPVGVAVKAEAECLSASPLAIQHQRSPVAEVSCPRSVTYQATTALLLQGRRGDRA